MLDTTIPFFVYGTLIPGQPNDYYWGKEIIKTAEAIYPHGRLVTLRAFPMLLESDPTSGGVKGTLIYINPTAYTNIMTLVDQLEEYDPENPDSPYTRVLREVVTADGEHITAWLYLGQPEIGQAFPTLPNGDWVAHLADTGSDGMSRWWKEKGEALLFGRSRD